MAELMGEFGVFYELAVLVPRPNRKDDRHAKLQLLIRHRCDCEVDSVGTQIYEFVCLKWPQEGFLLDHNVGYEETDFAIHWSALDILYLVVIASRTMPAPTTPPSTKARWFP